MHLTLKKNSSSMMNAHRNIYDVKSPDRYLLKKGKLDVARNLLAEGFPIEKVVKFTGLSKEDILKGK